MINEEEKAFSSQMNMGQMDMGGFAGPGMNYDTTNFDQTNEKNASLASMYQQKLNATQDNLNNDFKNFLILQNLTYSIYFIYNIFIKMYSIKFVGIF